MDGDPYAVAVFVFSGGMCADEGYASFFVIIVIIARTIKEHIFVPDPSVIGSYFDSSCRALFMITQNTIDRPTIDHLQLGKILRLQQGMLKGASSSKYGSIVSPISARNHINEKWLIFKKPGLLKGVKCVFLDSFHVVFVCRL